MTSGDSSGGGGERDRLKIPKAPYLGREGRVLSVFRCGVLLEYPRCSFVMTKVA